MISRKVALYLFVVRDLRVQEFLRAHLKIFDSFIVDAIHLGQSDVEDGVAPGFDGFRIDFLCKQRK